MTRAPDPAPEAEGGGRLATLDGLRAVAILLVMGFHYGVRWTPPHSNADLYPYHGFFDHVPILTPVLTYGWAGVELFFVISGFVICMTLERCDGLWDFARRRLARLWPAMLVCATLTMAVAQFGPDQWKVGAWGFLSSILFIDPTLFGGWIGNPGLGWVDGVYWTLWIEVRFYLMAALLFVLFRRRFLMALTGVMLVSFVAGLRALPYPHQALAWQVLLPTFLPYFVFGVGVFRFNARRTLRMEAGVALALSILVIVFQGWTSFQLPAGHPLGFAVVNAMIIAAFLLFMTGSPWLRPFAWRPLAKLGEASYSLYLIHSVTGLVLIEQLSKVMAWPLTLALVTVAMIGLSLAMFRWVEGPGKRLILRLTAKPFSMARPLRLWPTARRRAAALSSTLTSG